MEMPDLTQSRGFELHFHFFSFTSSCIFPLFIHRCPRAKERACCCLRLATNLWSPPPTAISGGTQYKYTAAQIRNYSLVRIKTNNFCIFKIRTIFIFCYINNYKILHFIKIVHFFGTSFLWGLITTNNHGNR